MNEPRASIQALTNVPYKASDYCLDTMQWWGHGRGGKRCVEHEELILAPALCPLGGWTEQEF